MGKHQVSFLLTRLRKNWKRRRLLRKPHTVKEILWYWPMSLGGSTHPGSAVPCLGMAQIQHRAAWVCRKTSQALLMPWATITTIFLSNSFLGSGSPTRHWLWINTAGLLDFWIKKYKVAHKVRVGLQKSVCSRNSKHISHRNNGDKAERGGNLLPSSSSLHPNPPKRI